MGQNGGGGEALTLCPTKKSPFGCMNLNKVAMERSSGSGS